MKVLDSTHREEHFAIDNPEIREHYVHETWLTGFNPVFDLGWKTRVKTRVLGFCGRDHHLGLFYLPEFIGLDQAATEAGSNKCISTPRILYYYNNNYIIIKFK